MIEIYDKGSLVASGSTSASGVVNTMRKDIMMVYISYSKGSEDSITLSFDVYEATTETWFSIQQDDGNNIVTYERTLSEGTYRIVIPTAVNEEKFRVNVAMNGDLSSPGTVKIWLVPNYYQF